MGFRLIAPSIHGPSNSEVWGFWRIQKSKLLFLSKSHFRTTFNFEFVFGPFAEGRKVSLFEMIGEPLENSEHIAL